MAFADTLPFSIGIHGKLTKRNTPSVLNMKNRPYYFWDGRAVVHMTHVTPPRGSGHTNKNKRVMTDQFRTQKGRIVQIKNDQDEMCLARAIVVARTHANKVDTPEWKKSWESIRK